MKEVLLRRLSLIPLDLRLSSRARLPSQPSESSPIVNERKLLTEPSIIFVHGLRGHRRKTWTKDGICWPEKLLPQEQTLSHVCVLTFGYDARIVNLDGRASLNSLFDHSMNLLNALSRERKRDVSQCDVQEVELNSNLIQRERPVIFVAHSLGGLIVKDVRHLSLLHKILSRQAENFHPAVSLCRSCW